MKPYEFTSIAFVPENQILGHRSGKLFESAMQLFTLPRLWRERLSYRSELRRLLKVGPHMIRDVGLAWEDANLEAKKPFWQK